MAKNYNIREMADAFKSKVYEAQADFGARYPLVAIKMAALFAKAPEEAYSFFMAMPEYLTGQKLNTAFKAEFLAGAGEGDEEPVGTPVEEDEAPSDAVPEKPVKAPKAEKASEGGKLSVEKIGRVELYEKLKELGLRDDFIEKMGTKNFSKPNLVEYYIKYGVDYYSTKKEVKVEAKPEKPAKAPKVKAEKTEADDDWDEGTEDKTEDLTKKTPLQLYDLCRERGIKAKTRQPKEYYLDLLQPKTGGPEEWDDTEDAKALEPAEKPAKKSGKSAPKKEVKQETPVEDDDDSWDI